MFLRRRSQDRGGRTPGVQGVRLGLGLGLGPSQYCLSTKASAQVFQSEAEERLGNQGIWRGEWGKELGLHIVLSQ